VTHIDQLACEQEAPMLSRQVMGMMMINDGMQQRQQQQQGTPAVGSPARYDCYLD